MELFAADGHDAGGCERVTGKSGMRPVQLASGECLVRLLHTSTNGYILQPYNPAHHARLVEQGEIEAMHVIVYSRSIGPDDHAMSTSV